VLTFRLLYNGCMSSVTIPPEQWPKIIEFLRECPDAYVGDEDRCKLFVEAVLWINRSGAQWRLLPAEYGKWNTIYKRFARWCDRGIWERMHEHFIEEPDIEYLIIDSTVVRAHQCAAGAPEKRGAIIAGARQKPGRIQHKGSCERGRTWQSTEIHADRRTETRHHSG
jgi:transposase